LRHQLVYFGVNSRLWDGNIACVDYRVTRRIVPPAPSNSNATISPSGWLKWVNAANPSR
jgi:hypothetical protein